MTFNKLHPGLVVYSVYRYKMGNTNMRTVGVMPVRIVSVNEDKQSVRASINGNPETTFYSASVAKWKKDKPLLIPSGFVHRLATRAETKAAKQKEAQP